jgi:glycerophosphoryl diester phosphodiesterase
VNTDKAYQPLPLVFGHRGASGYRPENTLEAFDLAWQQGSDAIECDLVPTLDGRLIIRHENLLSHTTNIASLPEFAELRRQKFMIWRDIDDWCSEDLTLEQIRKLRASERLPELRPGSAKFDGQFEIPTLDELILAETSRNRTLILELKFANYFLQFGQDTPRMLADELSQLAWQERNIKLVIESFDYESLRRCVEYFDELGLKESVEFVFLTESWRLPKEGPSGFQKYLDTVEEKFHGLSIEIKAIHELWPTAIEDIHARGLRSFVWTARAEDAETSIDEYYAHIIELGAHGIFADQPDLLRASVDALA